MFCSANTPSSSDGMATPAPISMPWGVTSTPGTESGTGRYSRSFSM
jgi:hypothetical protein